MTRLLLLLATILMPAEWSSAASFLDNLKLDCGVSVWSDWGPTINGYRTHTRQIYRQPQNGGAPCPELTETDKDPWINQTTAVKASIIHNSFLLGPGGSSNGRKRRQTEVKDRDILFIVDSSGSIEDTDFDTAKNNLAKLIGKVCGTIGPGKQHNQAALIIYSNKPQEIFDFDDYDNLVDLQNAVRNVSRIYGGTCTGEALEFAKTMFTEKNKGRRAHSVKEVVVLTDGASNCGPEIGQKAEELQNYTTMFAFAISKYNFQGKEEIESMVSTPISRHLFHLLDFIEFQKVVDKILPVSSCVPFDFK